MTIYEIDARMAGLIDPETGELLDYEAFASLQMERDTKIENMALWYKDLTAEAKAIREEQKALAERRRSAENKAERLKGYIETALGGEPWQSARAAVSYRKSTAVEIEDEAALIEELEFNGFDECLTYQTPKINKVELMKALKAGTIIKGAELVTRQNVQVK